MSVAYFAQRRNWPESIRLIKKALPFVLTLVALWTVLRNTSGILDISTTLSFAQPPTIPTPLPRHYRKFAVYMSVGDSSVFANNTVPSWVQSTREWDLCVLYYGRSYETVRHLRTFADELFLPPVQDGAGHFHLVNFTTPTPIRKFPGFWRVWQTPRGHKYLSKFSAMAIFDDDVTITNGSIDLLFDIQSVQQTMVLQPAMNRTGKNSYEVSLHQAKNSGGLRFTNLVEMGFPVFSQSALAKFMSVYNDQLHDWGVDIVFSLMFGKRPRQMAVVDAVAFYNPYPKDKPGGKSSANPGTAKNWYSWADAHNFSRTHPSSWPPKAYSTVKCALCPPPPIPTEQPTLAPKPTRTLRP